MAAKKWGMGIAAFGAASLSAAFLNITAQDLVRSEDLRTDAYIDMVGIPTVCAGETRGVTMGDRYTREECLEMLKARVAEFDRNLGKCITAPLPAATRSAIIQWAYNVGTGAACNSTAARRFNAGRIEEGCNALTDWNKGTFDARGAERQRAAGQTCTRKANGQYLCTIQGLTNRRAAERALCLSGIGK